MLLRTSCKTETGRGNLDDKASGEERTASGSDVNGHRKELKTINSF